MGQKYLLELGGDEEGTGFGTNMFDSYLLKFIEIKNPDSDVLSQEQYAYIKEYAKKADLAIVNLNGYEEYIDIPSVIDWFILNEFSYNLDGTFRRSDFLLKKKGGKLYMATYWDYDYAFGNFWRDSADFDEWICLGKKIQYEFSKTASIKTYDGQLDYLKKYIEKRYKWMDKTIKAM